VCYCHHGVRSLHAALILGAAGFKDAVSLRGGIEAWSELIDPAIPRY
jgi:rhodanese-related sulfurtransferase